MKPDTTRPLFSVITACFNSQKTLRDTIQSVGVQTFPHDLLEQVFVDGLSADATLALIREHTQHPYQLVSEKDAGIYDAMNKGITLARGEWLCFLNSDDVFYDPQVLADVAAFIHSQASLDVVYGDALLKFRKTRYCGEMTLTRLLQGTNLNHQTIFYHRSVFARLGTFNLRYPLFADWDMNIRCFKHPQLTIRYIERLICVFDDANGASDGRIDVEFMRELPCYFQFSSLRFPIRYFVGKYLKRPLKRIAQIFTGNKP